MLPPRSFEFQMLYGMADPIKDALVGDGAAGAGLYALRRTAPRHGVSGAAAAGEHLQRIVLAGQLSRARARGAIAHESRRNLPAAADAAKEAAVQHPGATAFHNEPLTDFSARRQSPGDARCPGERGQAARALVSAGDRRPADHARANDRFVQPVASQRRSSARAAGRRRSMPMPRWRAAKGAFAGLARRGASRSGASCCWNRAPDHAPAAFRAGGLGSVRMRQALARGRRRRRRGDRFLRLLRPRNAPAGRRRSGATCRAKRTSYVLRAARRGGRHRAVEFSAGDPVRHDRRGPGHRQHRHHEAGRAIAGHRRQADGNLCRGRDCRPAWSIICRASARRSARRW